MTFDRDAIQAQDPTFNPAIVAQMGVLIQNTDASPTPTTLWLDSVQYPL